MLTRKHFQALANALQSQRPNQEWVKTPEDRIGYTCAVAQWTLDCRAIADVCQRENPAFDRTKFLQACGIEA